MGCVVIWVECFGVVCDGVLFVVIFDYDEDREFYYFCNMVVDCRVGE